MPDGVQVELELSYEGIGALDEARLDSLEQRYREKWISLRNSPNEVCRKVIEVDRRFPSRA